MSTGGSDVSRLLKYSFTALGRVKPGPFRRLTSTALLWIADWATPHLFANADLAGVKTIHFARWVFLDDKRRLIFASNYDGSLETYMGDFIDKVAWGLNAIFSNGVGCPRTNWLVRDGAWNEGAFKHYIHTHQVPAHVWYTAYGNLTNANIEQNARIRLRDDHQARLVSERRALRVTHADRAGGIDDQPQLSSVALDQQPVWLDLVI